MIHFHNTLQSYLCSQLLVRRGLRLYHQRLPSLWDCSYWHFAVVMARYCSLPSLLLIISRQPMHPRSHPLKDCQICRVGPTPSRDLSQPHRHLIRWEPGWLVECCLLLWCCGFQLMFAFVLVSFVLKPTASPSNSPSSNPTFQPTYQPTTETLPTAHPSKVTPKPILPYTTTTPEPTLPSITATPTQPPSLSRIQEIPYATVTETGPLPSDSSSNNSFSSISGLIASVVLLIHICWTSALQKSLHYGGWSFFCALRSFFSALAFFRASLASVSLWLFNSKRDGSNWGNSYLPLSKQSLNSWYSTLSTWLSFVSLSRASSLTTSGFFSLALWDGRSFRKQWKKFS